MRVLFFGQIREVLNTSLIEMDSAPASVALLKQELANRGELWQEFIINKPCLCAVNQTMVNDTTALEFGDEVAFFPPVTGG